MPVTIITGGSGLIGRSLTKYLTSLHHEVIIFSRNNKESHNSGTAVIKKWDPQTGLIDHEALASADYIINLAGAGVMDKTWTETYKNQIVNSRTASGKLLVDTLNKISHRTKAFISASAIGWYGSDNTDLKHTYGFIETDPPAKNFLGETCLLWEECVDPVESMHIRLVKLRFGIVLANEGGAFPEFKKSLKFGVASILGNGKQMVSWIHIDDICRMIGYAMEHDEISGVYNAVAPEPVRNKELILTTATKLKNRFFIPLHIPSILIKWLLGKRSTEVLKSTTVSSKKIRVAGFTFRYPNIKLAVDHLSETD